MCLSLVHAAFAECKEILKDQFVIGFGCVTGIITGIRLSLINYQLRLVTLMLSVTPFFVDNTVLVFFRCEATRMPPGFFQLIPIK
jgi:hypothetical protein